MITVIKTRDRKFAPVVPDGQQCLYVRRDVFPDQTYEEYAYIGPVAEVAAIAERAAKVDIVQLDELLHQGKSFDEALKELGA